MSDPMDIETTPRFIKIQIDRSLLPGLSVLAHSKTCDSCLFLYENRSIMSIVPSAKTIGDVMSAIKEKYRLAVAIKLSADGIVFLPDLPIEILEKFEGKIFG